MGTFRLLTETFLPTSARLGSTTARILTASSILFRVTFWCTPLTLVFCLPNSSSLFFSTSQERLSISTSEELHVFDRTSPLHGLTSHVDPIIRSFLQSDVRSFPCSFDKRGPLCLSVMFTTTSSFNAA